MLMLQSLNGFHSGFSFLERSFTGTTNFNPDQISSTAQTLISTKPSSNRFSEHLFQSNHLELQKQALAKKPKSSPREPRLFSNEKYLLGIFVGYWKSNG
jgi:hypothetical protein